MRVRVAVCGAWSAPRARGAPIAARGFGLRVRGRGKAFDAIRRWPLAFGGAHAARRVRALGRGWGLCARPIHSAPAWGAPWRPAPLALTPFSRHSPILAPCCARRLLVHSHARVCATPCVGTAALRHCATAGSPKPVGARRNPWREDEDEDAGGGNVEAAQSPKGGARRGLQLGAAGAAGTAAAQGAAQDDPGGGIITQYGAAEAQAARHSQQPLVGQRGAGEDGHSVGQPAWRSMLACCFSGAQGRGGYQAAVDSLGFGRQVGGPMLALGRFPLAEASKSHPRAPPHLGPPSLPAMLPEDAGKKTLVLDLDETLVHSSFKEVENADFVIPIDIEGRLCNCYVLKRPWVDQFIESVAKHFEVVVYTASLSKYGDPVLDLLDPKRLMRYRLFRESCALFEGNFVKDLSSLGRPMKNTIIIDNSPHSYVFQPENAIPIGTYIDEPHDTELIDLLPYLEVLSGQDDVRKILGEGVR